MAGTGAITCRRSRRCAIAWAGSRRKATARVAPRKKRQAEARARGPRSAGAKRTPDWLPVALVLAAATALHAAVLRAPFFADDYLFLDQVRALPLVDALVSHDPLG